MFRRFFEFDGWHEYEERKIKREHRRMARASVHFSLFDESDYVGAFAYGRERKVGPEKPHEHDGDEKHCVWCGSSEYGRICIHSPYTVHRHGHGANKCIWCGEVKDNGRCLHSPTGRHEK